MFLEEGGISTHVVGLTGAWWHERGISDLNQVRAVLGDICHADIMHAACPHTPVRAMPTRRSPPSPKRVEAVDHFCQDSARLPVLKAQPFHFHRVIPSNRSQIESTLSPTSPDPL